MAVLLSTERMALRDFTLADEALLVELDSDPSRRVMEKCGMRLVRSFRADWPFRIPGDEAGDVEYAIERADWLRGATERPSQLSQRVSAPAQSRSTHLSTAHSTANASPGSTSSATSSTYASRIVTHFWVIWTIGRPPLLTA